MKIVYWSGTGNTERMAELISQGIKDSGKDAELINVSDVDESSFLEEDVLILGCPSMGSEVLEETTFEPFIESISTKVSGKKAALFGSYGWGSGEWMEDFKNRMIDSDCEVSIDPLIILNEPDDYEDDCIEYGKKIAAL